MRAFIAAIQATRKQMRSHLLTGALLALVTIVPTITPAQPADNSAMGVVSTTTRRNVRSATAGLPTDQASRNPMAAPRTYGKASWTAISLSR